MFRQQGEHLAAHQRSRSCTPGDTVATLRIERPIPTKPPPQQSPHKRGESTSLGRGRLAVYLQAKGTSKPGSEGASMTSFAKDRHRMRGHPRRGRTKAETTLVSSHVGGYALKADIFPPILGQRLDEPFKLCGSLLRALVSTDRGNEGNYLVDGSHGALLIMLRVPSDAWSPTLSDTKPRLDVY